MPWSFAPYGHAHGQKTVSKTAGGLHSPIKGIGGGLVKLVYLYSIQIPLLSLANILPARSLKGIGMILKFMADSYRPACKLMMWLTI